MKIHTQIKKFLLLAFVVALSFTAAYKLQAGTADDLTGYAWSANTGWLQLNNCDATGNCVGADYGLKLGTRATTATTDTTPITGYAWSSNLGWVSFEPASISGCTPTFGGRCDAHIDWKATPANDGTIPIKGWARVCSVFQSGCSGALKSADSLGRCSGASCTAASYAWDGWIALGDTAGTNLFGVRVHPTTGNIKGMAWGHEVVGWVDFTGAKIRMTPPQQAAIEYFDQRGCVATLQDRPQFAWVSTGTTDCSLTSGADVDQGTVNTTSQISIQSDGTSPIATPITTGTRYWYKTSIPLSSVRGADSRTYTLTCTQTGGPDLTRVQTVNLCPAETGDLCPNIDGVQLEIPEGFTKDRLGNCITDTVEDVCPNIDGFQLTMPLGMMYDKFGNCVMIPLGTDMCNNIDGIQIEIPEGMYRDKLGNCWVLNDPLDVCKNIDGDQSEVPDGYTIDRKGNCVKVPICTNLVCDEGSDLCLNIDGIQTRVPRGLVRDAKTGYCVNPNGTDMCPNIEGTQYSVPAGYTVDANGNCAKITITYTEE